MRRRQEVGLQEWEKRLRSGSFARCSGIPTPGTGGGVVISYGDSGLSLRVVQRAWIGQRRKRQPRCKRHLLLPAHSKQGDDLEENGVAEVMASRQTGDAINIIETHVELSSGW